LFEIEVQNETHQTQDRLKFVAVPRIGEGIRLMEQDGYWASYDVLDLWYEKAEYGEVWVPFLHVRKTPPELDTGNVLRPNVLAVRPAPGTRQEPRN
jgi:hypothetical protein